jgi:preprotein translocase subunit YajC
MLTMENPILMVDQANSMMSPLFMILAMAAIMYFLMYLPTKKRQKKVEEMLSAIKNGDKVITSSGIYGVVAGIKDKTFVIKIADQVKIEVAKSAVAGLQNPDDTQE